MGRSAREEAEPGLAGAVGADDGEESPENLEVYPTHRGVDSVPLIHADSGDTRRARGDARTAQPSLFPHPEQKRLPAGFTKPHECVISKLSASR